MNDYNKGVLSTVLMAFIFLIVGTFIKGVINNKIVAVKPQLNTEKMVVISHVTCVEDCKYYSRKYHFDDEIRYSVINKDTKLYELRMGSYLNRVGIIHITSDEFIDMSIESDRIEGRIIK